MTLEIVRGAPTRTVPELAELEIAVAVAPTDAVGSAHDTYLPHWTSWQRAVHSLCRRSRFWNSVVAAYELHAGREELLSLPQYMALCPTGQCNASCAFCSVTTNRTGIIKKQLPYEKVDRFLSPVSSTIRLFGLEGNGEPTLYDRFNDLLSRLTCNDAPLYLITNGERLTREQLALLLACPTDSINFSLNAATAETHRSVMKLKGFDAVVANIRRLVRWRGDRELPVISASFVVTRDNVHEVRDFLRFAEWDLKVDKILVRPLSEIANEDGTVEDLRDLVPYESDIEDMLDSVEEYVATVPRRAVIILDPESFRAFRPDPVGRAIGPRGYADQMCVPRKRYWFPPHEQATVRWGQDQLTVQCAESAPRVIYESLPFPAGGAERMELRCRVLVKTGELELRLMDETGALLARASESATAEDAWRPLTLAPSLPSLTSVKLALAHSGGGVDASIKFEALRSPSRGLLPVSRLPHSSRWQIDSPGAGINWSGNAVSIRWSGPSGPYLLRSYGVPCRTGERLDFPVSICVDSGRLGIGILSADARRWTHQWQFDVGVHAATLRFDAGAEERFQIVLYSAAASPLAASVDWGQCLGALPIFVRHDIQFDRLHLPPSRLWRIETAAARAQWTGAAVRLRCSGAAGAYLLKSARFPCAHLWNFVQTLPLSVTVRTGTLGIGLLGERSQLFVDAFTFRSGHHDRSLKISTYNEDELRVVVFAKDLSPLDAEIDFGRAMRSTDQWDTPRDQFDVVDTQDDRAGLTTASSVDAVRSMGTLGRPATLLQRVARIYARHGAVGVLTKAAHRLFHYPLIALPTLPVKKVGKAILRRYFHWRFGAPKFHCQKPWTDLNNFSVDGRMDVCCIATGPSQKRFALGNIFEDSFQDVWNGERMREFRRTVNGPKKLPPCERCPMANNYVPPF